MSAPDLTSTIHVIAVVVALPAHVSLSTQVLHYSHSAYLEAGTLVRVPLGKREVLGIVWDDAEKPSTEVTLRAISHVFCSLPALDINWRNLITFTAQYYHRSLGEVALSALPPQLRNSTAEQLTKRLKKQLKKDEVAETKTCHVAIPTLTKQQQLALQTIVTASKDSAKKAPNPIVLHGVTGSGKTEVYLQVVQHILGIKANAQVLIMVPEINLTPQLQHRFTQRFPQYKIVTMHSGMTPAQRLNSWLSAHTGQARIILGTRVAVLSSIPHLSCIVVDEEHDASYKQQEGARYSARDLAVYRAKQHSCLVILGSATPSLESWYHSCNQAEFKGAGRYIRLEMPQRVGDAALPTVRLVDMAQQAYGTVLSEPVLEAMQARLRCGEQTLILLNRRGYAPVLHCQDCDWKSSCPYCSAYLVYHKVGKSLRCHHCGLTQNVTPQCPQCGNQDIKTLGLGTQQLEESLAQNLQLITRSNGEPLRVLRIDADTTRKTGSLEKQLAQAENEDIDVLLGTQMLAKGHDFRRVTLVVVLNADAALFSSDFRAPERLFALLMQAGGRAGRDAAVASESELFVQTRFLQHPLFAALRKHDYEHFAKTQLQDRLVASMTPFSYQALLRAESRQQIKVEQFLQNISQQMQQLAVAYAVQCYPPVPMVPQRIANRERMQMLIESANRKALQQFLQAMCELIHQHKNKEISRWAIDVDPLSI